MGRLAGSDSGRSVYRGPLRASRSHGVLGSRPEAGSSPMDGHRAEDRGAERRASDDRLKRLVAEFAERVEAAPGELARDRQRGARVREAALPERQVVLVVRALLAA